MYAQFFGLKQDPFSIAPDPHYLFMSERHREALAHLIYGLDGGGGFVLLTGEIGTGKTTVCRCFLEQIPKNCNVAYIFNPKLTVGELLQSVCDEFHVVHQAKVPGAETVKDCLDPLNAFLLASHAAGQNNVLIIDEAQNLSADVLEQLRLLTNLETNERKLLQIILIGQPELRRMLAQPELEQLAQRVIARFHLDALSEAETTQYIDHRMAVAGATGAVPFDRHALHAIHTLSHGVPRRINLLCGRALLGAYAKGQRTVDKGLVQIAAGEVFDRRQDAALPPRHHGRTLIFAVLLGVAALLVYRNWPDSAPNPALVKAPQAAPARAAEPAPAVIPEAKPLPGTPELLQSLAPEQLQTEFAPPLLLEASAWRELAGAWGIEPAAANLEPCRETQRQGVVCFKSASLSLALIRQLDRPGILTLRDDKRQAVYVRLIALDGNSATLASGTVTRRVSLAALARVWQGDFATYWRAPAAYFTAVPGSTSGALAEWLTERLDKLPDAVAAGAAPPLRARIAQFQLTQGLVPDGVAGPITIMQLNRVTGLNEPTLHGSGQGK
jgi:general secretion pathway protein A